MLIASLFCYSSRTHLPMFSDFMLAAYANALLNKQHVLYLTLLREEADADF